MASTDYDIITVGGGLGGASLAKVMAEHGSRVLVIERETKFKDRVRGEAMPPWGVADARRIGILETIMAAGGHELPKMMIYVGQMQIGERDLVATTPENTPMLAFFHPQVQEALLAAAAEAGAEVQRGARVTLVTPGETPNVVVEHKGEKATITARVVGVIFLAMSSTLMLSVSGSISQNTGRPPASRMASVEDTKVIVLVSTSCPSTSAHSRPRCNAAVQELSDTA